MARLIPVLMLLLSVQAHAGDILASGNSMNQTDPNFQANLAQLPHTFEFVESQSFSVTDLTGYTAVWLDGFSDYPGLDAEALITFMTAGGTALIQHPGFGSQGVTAYPLGDEIRGVFTSPNFPTQIRITDADHALNANLTDALLSNWDPIAAVGYFAETGSFAVISDTGDSAQPVTLVRQVGQGLLIYTQQAVAQTLDVTELTADSGPLQLLNNIFSASDSQPLTPPNFISTADFRLTPNGDLEALLPDPNSDGLDPDGNSPLSWRVGPWSNGAFFGEPQIIASQIWPAAVHFTADQLPQAPYHMALQRLRGEEVSEPALFNAPTVEEDPGVRRLYRRWLVHLPRQAGGFDGVIEIANRHPGDAVTVSLIGYAADGAKLATETLTIPSGDPSRFALYGSGTDGLFTDPEVYDRLSHLAIFEAGRFTHVALQYVARSTGFGVWVDEADMASEAVNGREFRMDGAAPNASFFDAVAVLNLSSAVTTDVTVIRFDASGAPAGSLTLPALLPGTKRLSVLTFDFDTFLPGASYRFIASGGTGASIQVLGLVGASGGAFFAPARVVRR